MTNQTSPSGGLEGSAVLITGGGTGTAIVVDGGNGLRRARRRVGLGGQRQPCAPPSTRTDVAVTNRPSSLIVGPYEGPRGDEPVSAAWGRASETAATDRTTRLSNASIWS